MPQNEHDIVQGIVISRKNLLDLVIVAVLLAFGINLIASQFLALPIATPLVTTLLGAVICLASIFYIAKNLYGNRLRDNTYRAFVVFDQPQRNLIPVPRCEFSEMISLYIEAAFAKNSTIKARWDSQPLETYMFSESEDEHIYSMQLLFEAVEYFFLENLSVHLSDYFSNKTFKESNLIKYGRKDIPDVLLSNTFLEMFSRSMRERPAFQELLAIYEEAADDKSGTIIGGPRYQKLELVLPKGSKVKRTGDQKLEIETKRLKLALGTRVSGIGMMIPDEFVQYYLRRSDDTDTYYIDLNIEIKILIKIRSLLSITGWSYYRWIDSFLRDFEKGVSKKAFFDRIGWENTAVILECLHNISKEKRRPKSVHKRQRQDNADVLLSEEQDKL